MRRCALIAVLAAALVWSLATAARAQGPASGCGPEAVTTRHAIRLEGRAFAYTARAGFLPIRDGLTGELRACVFYTAYLRPAPAHGRPRPLTFLWNGGPGANSSWLHFEAFGPRRVSLAADPTQPAPAPRLEDNPLTLLDQSDLVFVDPVGTGYSRPARPDLGAEFYNVKGDIAATAEVIRVYRARAGAWRAPLVLAGESYGVWRASGVAQALEARGVRVAGLVLISGGVQLGPVMPPETLAALFTPNRTAAAFYHHRLAPDLERDFTATLEAAEAWSRDVYAPALLHAETLTPDQRAAIVQGLARFTGLEPARIDAKSLVVQRGQFATALLGGGRTLEALDTRLTAPAPTDQGRIGLISDYMRRDLGIDVDLAYLGLGDDGYTPLPDAGRPGINDRWLYNQGGELAATPSPNPPDSPTAQAARRLVGEGPPGGRQPWLRTAMRDDPELKAFIASAWFDSYNSCLGDAELLKRLPAGLAGRLTARCYKAGHVIYRDRAAAVALRDDLRRFYAALPQAGDAP